MPDAEGFLLEPDVAGFFLVPDAEGFFLVPDAEGFLLEPDVDGFSLMPDGEGSRPRPVKPKLLSSAGEALGGDSSVERSESGRRCHQ